jgi:hypothetical protein
MEDLNMKKFIEGEKYRAGTTEILIDRRTAKYLVVGLADGSMKWAYLREEEGIEHIICGEKITARNII